MKPEEQRIAIARAYGWNIEQYRMEDGSINIAPLPDYINDLNAMYEAEKRLGDGRYPWDKYCDLLGGSLYHCSHATAAKRAEAFLRTLNLWTDDT